MYQLLYLLISWPLVDVDGSRARSVVRFVRDVLTHANLRAQACLSEPLPRANPTQKQPNIRYQPMPTQHCPQQT